jgi:hypothetical protein
MCAQEEKLSNTCSQNITWWKMWKKYIHDEVLMHNNRSNQWKGIQLPLFWCYIGAIKTKYQITII